MPYFTLSRKLNIRSKEYNLYEKPDRLLGALLRIEETGGPGNRPSSSIFADLDTGIEICDRLDRMEQYYQEFRPLPRNCRLCSDVIVQPNSTYQLEFNIVEYRQVLRITQNRSIVTRKHHNAITILDIGEFRRQLLQFVEDLSNTYLNIVVEEEDGITKVIRGKRAAVIYCPGRPWPWTRSYQPEKLLFDPILTGMILFNRDVEGMRNYCETTYPDLMVDIFIDMNEEEDQSVDYRNLSVRWIRRGDQFRINERPGMMSLKREDRWFTA